MNDSRVDVVQLQRRDPQAWTAMLSAYEELADVAVTAVTAMPLHPGGETFDHGKRLARYLVSLANDSDPIPFIGKTTGSEEVRFYRDLASELPFIAPRCWFAHAEADHGWVILEDVPRHVSDGKWTPQDVEVVIRDMARLHFAFWDQDDLTVHYPWLSHFVGRDQVTYTWRQLRREHTVYFEEGPGALISDHALKHLGRLAPTFVAAANGLAVMRALGGWPGVIGESHMAAAADLLDDPLPMLEPLLRLPQTLLHGNMTKRHWHLTLFGEQRLVDWHQVGLGPSICDLISFQEQFSLQFTAQSQEIMVTESLPLVTEETIIDSYLLAMKSELGPRFDSRQIRQAIPAARCLQIITTSFPYFASWFNRMPDKYTWQRMNRLAEQDAVRYTALPKFGIKPVMREIFRRFLHAYRML